MGKVIAAINMTLDGFCDHTAVNADDETHAHYSNLLRGAGAILHGRVTYQLMQFWQEVLKNPTGNKSMAEFATVIDAIPKVVFSRTLKDTGWESARLAKRDFAEEVGALKQQSKKDILIGSRSLIIAAMNLNLADEYQICVHPVVAGGGLPLFEHIDNRVELKLLKTKRFACGAVVFYYAPLG